MYLFYRKTEKEHKHKQGEGQKDREGGSGKGKDLQQTPHWKQNPLIPTTQRSWPDLKLRFWCLTVCTAQEPHIGYFKVKKETDAKSNFAAKPHEFQRKKGYDFYGVPSGLVIIFTVTVNLHYLL